MALAQSDNPDELWAPGLTPDLTNPISIIDAITSSYLHWLVVLTKSRQEKALARYCQQHGIPYFLPYRRSWSSDRANPRRTTRQRVLVPLFDGFVFVATPHRLEYTMWEVLKLSHRTFSKLDVRDQRSFTTQLRAIAASLPEARRLVEVLPKGAPARVVAGPFRGLTGLLTQEYAVNPEDPHVKLVLDMGFLGMNVEVEVVRSRLEIQK